MLKYSTLITFKIKATYLVRFKCTSSNIGNYLDVQILYTSFRFNVLYYFDESYLFVSSKWRKLCLLEDESRREMLKSKAHTMPWIMRRYCSVVYDRELHSDEREYYIQSCTHLQCTKHTRNKNIVRINNQKTMSLLLITHTIRHLSDWTCKATVTL